MVLVPQPLLSIQAGLSLPGPLSLAYRRTALSSSAHGVNQKASVIFSRVEVLVLRLYHYLYRQVIFPREEEIPLVVRRDGHNGGPCRTPAGHS